MAITEWEVVKGDNIWNIAAETLMTPQNPQPSLQDIVVRMQELIKLNLDTLKASPGKGNPDLIYPGMKLKLTAAPSPGDAAKKGKDEPKGGGDQPADAAAPDAAVDIGEPSVYDPDAPKAPPVRPGKDGAWDIGEPSVVDPNAGPYTPVRTPGLPPPSLVDPDAPSYRSPGPVAKDPSYMTEENAVRRAMSEMARTGRVPQGFEIVNGQLVPDGSREYSTFKGQPSPQSDVKWMGPPNQTAPPRRPAPDVKWMGPPNQTAPRKNSPDVRWMGPPNQTAPERDARLSRLPTGARGNRNIPR